MKKKISNRVCIYRKPRQNLKLYLNTIKMSKLTFITLRNNLIVSFWVKNLNRPLNTLGDTKNWSRSRGGGINLSEKENTNGKNQNIPAS